MPAEATTQEVRSRFSDAELCHALESNQIEWLRHKAALPWAKVQDDGDVLRVFVDPGRGWPRNLVGHARFSSESAHRRVGEIVAAHTSAPTILVHTKADVVPVDSHVIEALSVQFGAHDREIGRAHV